MQPLYLLHPFSIHYINIYTISVHRLSDRLFSRYLTVFSQSVALSLIIHILTQLTKDKIMRISGYSEASTELVIPTTINGFSVTSIAWQTFSECSNLTNVTFENTSGWYYVQFPSSTSGDKNSISANVTNSSTNATNITSTYLTYYWKRNA